MITLAVVLVWIAVAVLAALAIASGIRTADERRPQLSQLEDQPTPPTAPGPNRLEVYL